MPVQRGERGHDYKDSKRKYPARFEMPSCARKKRARISFAMQRNPAQKLFFALPAPHIIPVLPRDTCLRRGFRILEQTRKDKKRKSKESERQKLKSFEIDDKPHQALYSGDMV